MISLKNISKKFASPTGDFLALENISLDLDKTGLYVITGPSGSGKSTLLNIIGLLEKPTEGSYYFDNLLVGSMKESDLLHYKQHEIGYIYQHYHLLGELSVMDNLVLPLLAKGVKKEDALRQAFEILEYFRLDNIKDQPAATLSGGEAQRVAIMRVLLGNPKVILADEPTGALDHDNSLMVMKILKTVSEFLQVIMVTHNDALAHEFADGIIKIEKGKICGHTVIAEGKEQSGERAAKTKPNREVFPLIDKNFRKRDRKSDLVSLSSISVSLLLTGILMLMVFSFPVSIKSNINRTLDKTVVRVSKKKIIAIKDSPLNLQKSERPKEEELMSLTAFLDCAQEPDFEGLISPAPVFYFNGHNASGLMFRPVLKFESDEINRQTLKGKYDPDLENQIIINETAYESLASEGWEKKYPLWLNINTYVSFTVSDYASVSGQFSLQKPFYVSCVIRESELLKEPVVYYEHGNLKKILKDAECPALSEHLQRKSSWYDALLWAADDDMLSNYQNLIFLKDINQIGKLKALEEKSDKEATHFTFGNSYISKADFVGQLNLIINFSFAAAAVIIWSGSLLTVGFINMNKFQARRKDYALLMNLGVGKTSLRRLFDAEQTKIMTYSVLISSMLLSVSAVYLNKIFFMISNIDGIIDLSMMVHSRNLPIMFMVMICFLFAVSRLMNSFLFYRTGIRNSAYELKGE